MWCQTKKKGLFRYVNSKRESKENIRLILEDGHLAIKDEEKAEVLNAFLL